MPPYYYDELTPTSEDIQWDGDLSRPFFFLHPGTGEREEGLSYQGLQRIHQDIVRREHRTRQHEREARRERFPNTLQGRLYSYINQQVDVYLARQEQEGSFPSIEVLSYVNDLDVWHDTYMESGSREAGEFPLPDPLSPVATLIDWNAFNNLFGNEE